MEGARVRHPQITRNCAQVLLDNPSEFLSAEEVSGELLLRGHPSGSPGRISRVLLNLIYFPEFLDGGSIEVRAGRDGYPKVNYYRFLPSPSE